MRNEVATKAKFARQQNVSRAMVTKWVCAGMPVRPDGRLDVREASAWLTAHTERKPRTKTKAEGNTLVGARRRKENALAELREMEAAERRGRLISRAAVERAWTEIGVQFRDALMGLPARVCNRLPAEWRREVQTVANDEVRGVLTALADQIRHGGDGKKLETHAAEPQKG